MSSPLRVLVVADEVAPQLHRPEVKSLEPDLVISCGDLPFEYLEYLVTMLNVPLLFVPGNHDPELTSRPPDPVLPNAWTWNSQFGDELGPRGCENIDGRVVEVAGLRIAGLGGCIRYNEGPNQYTQRQMTRRALKLEALSRSRIAGRRDVDLLVTHAPPTGFGEAPDPAHLGISALTRLTRVLRPTYLFHGHIHPYGIHQPDRRSGTTTIVNVIPYRMLEVEA